MVKIKKFEQSGLIFTDTASDQSFGVDIGLFSKGHIGSLPPMQALFVSHIHGDHYCLDIVKDSQIERVFAAREVHEDLLAHRVPSQLVVAGDIISAGGMEAKAFAVDHGPISKPISNLGFRFTLGGKNVLFCGDMKVASSVPDVEYDVTVIPVSGGNVIMDFAEATQFLLSLRHPGLIVPIHYHGQADPESGLKFQAYARDQFQVQVVEVNQELELT